RVEDGDRRQEADQVAEEDGEHPDMEQHRADDELPAPQKLARAGPPRIGLAVVAHDGAEREHGERDIGIDAEDERVEIGIHGGTFLQAAGGSVGRVAASRDAARMRVRRRSGPQAFSPALPPKVTASSCQTRSSASRSSGSSSGASRSSRNSLPSALPCASASSATKAPA